MRTAEPAARHAGGVKPVMLITGAANGLGRALARAAARDYRLALLDIHETAGLAVADELRRGGAEVFFLHADVSDERRMRQAVERIQRRWARLDVLINNAGLAAAGPFEALDAAGWQTLWNVNVMGAVNGCQAALRLMKRQGRGYLVNVAALPGISAPPGMASYVACNAALIGLSEALAAELEGFGVAVSVVCPDWFASDLARHMTSSDPLSRARLERAVAASVDSAETLAAHILNAMAARPLYIFPQPQARREWRRKRRNPLRFLRRMRGVAERLRRYR